LNRRLFIQGLLSTALVPASYVATKAASPKGFIGVDLASGPDITAVAFASWDGEGWKVAY
jgi:hypothetical protein